jgi:hypothetical protein
MKGMEGMRPPLLRGLKPASLCVAVPLGYLRWLLVEEVADEVADAAENSPQQAMVLKLLLLLL